MKTWHIDSVPNRTVPMFSLCAPGQQCLHSRGLPSTWEDMCHAGNHSDLQKLYTEASQQAQVPYPVKLLPCRSLLSLQQSQYSDLKRPFSLKQKKVEHTLGAQWSKLMWKHLCLPWSLLTLKSFTLWNTAAAFSLTRALAHHVIQWV